jgi:hypothetical protein
MDVDRNHETSIELSSVSLVQNGLYVKNLVLLCSSRALQQTLHNVSSATVLLSRRQEALVIVPSGNVLNTIVRLQKRLNAVRSDAIPDHVDGLGTPTTSVTTVLLIHNKLRAFSMGIGLGAGWGATKEGKMTPIFV